MKGDNMFEQYTKVPIGSRLVTRVTGDPGEWDTRLELTDGVSIVEVKESLLVLGWEMPLPTATSLFVTWYMTFLTDSQLEIRAEIRKSDDSIYSEATEWVVAGAGQGVPQRGLYIRTA